MPEVTVLMPVYNAEKYLREAIESILEQSYSDFEFLMIDDGSTDRSVKIINSYDDSRIRLVRNEQNLGIGNTLNKGIELASCDLIARMDADDISLTERLMKQYQYMNENPAVSLVSTNIEKITGDGETIHIFEAITDFMYFNLTFHCYGIYHPTVMYRKQAVQDVGKYPLAHSEDFKLWSKLIRKYPFYNIPEVLVKYRVSEQSISHSRLFKEYKDDEKLNIIDNLKYFAGDDYVIPDEWIEAYRHNFEPLTQPPKVREMAKCIKELDFITQCILAKDNVNRDSEAIRTAAAHKKKHLLDSFLKEIPAVYRIPLLLKTGHYYKLGDLIFLGPLRRTKNMITSA